MWKWLDKVSEFAVTNVRVVRDAWGAFLVWCIIALVACWYAIGIVYDTRLTNAQSTVSTLTTRLNAVEGELRDIRAIPSTPKPPPLERDPDTVYQLGVPVGRAPGGEVDAGSSAVRFSRLIGTEDFNVQASMEYRRFLLTDCQHGSYATQGSFGVVVQRSFADVICRISGLHP